MAWPYTFAAMTAPQLSYLDDNFNAALQSGAPASVSTLDVTGASTLRGVTATTVTASAPAGEVALSATGNGTNAIVANFSATTGILVNQTGATGAPGCIVNLSNAGSAFEYFEYNGVVIGGIELNGTTAVIYATTSDAALKALHGPADGSILAAIPVHDASFTAEPSARRPMVVAQELAAVAPWAVRDPAPGSDAPCMVDHGSLVPLLIAALQGALCRIAALETKAGIATAPTAACAAAVAAVAKATGSAVVQAAIARGSAPSPTPSPTSGTGGASVAS